MTGVQTCALPICGNLTSRSDGAVAESFRPDRAETGGMTACLHLEPHSMSVRPILTRPAWAWVMQRLRRLLGDRMLTILYRQGTCDIELKRVLLEKDSRTYTFAYSAQGMSGILKEWKRQCPESDKGFISLLPASALAPVEAVEELLREHMSSGSWLTYYSGLPAGVSPVVSSAQALDFASRIEDCANGRDLGVSLATLLEHGVATAVASGLTDATIRKVEAVERLALDNSRIPTVVDFCTFRGLARLHRVTGGFTNIEVEGGEMLQRWKEDTIKDFRRRRWPSLKSHHRVFAKPPSLLFASNASG